MYGITISFFVLAFLAAVLGELTDHWSQQDLNRVLKNAKSIVRSKDSSNQDVFYSLSLLNDSKDLKDSCDCKSLSDRIQSASAETYFAVQSAQICGCDYAADEKLSASTSDRLSSSDISELVASIGLSNSLRKLQEAQPAAFSKLHDLLFTEGELSLSFSDATGTLSQVHLLLEVLNLLKDDEHAKSLFAEIFDKLFAMIPGGDGDLLSDPTLIHPLSRLSGKKLRIEKAALKTAAEQLINMKYSTNPNVVYNAYKSLEIVRTYKAAPYHVVLNKFSFRSGDDLALQVEVFDVLGSKVDAEETEIVSLKMIGKDSFAAQNVKEKGSSITVPSADVSVGRYALNIGVTLAGKQATTKTQSVIVVTESIIVDGVSYAVSDSKLLPGDLTTVSKQNSVSIVAAAAAQEVVHVTFKVSGRGKESIKRPHQAFVRFTEVETSTSYVFAASKVADGSSYEYHAAISVGDETETFDFRTGEYLVSILVADSTVAQPLEWVLGSVDLKFPTKNVPILPLYAKSLLHTSDTTLKPLPEIEHQMRPPAKRASNFMAGIFTLLTVLPLAVFIVFNLGLKPDFAKLNSLTSILFVVLLGAILALYGGYWLALEGVSFYDTIKYLFVLLPVTVLVGKYSLNSIATARFDKEKKA